MITYKVKFKRFIVNMYVPEKKTGKVVLLLPGLPISSNIYNILKPLLDSGSVVFYPTFSGSFDSAGIFSASQAVRDVKDLYPLTQSESVTELYFGKEIQLGKPTEVILVAMSFGSGIALHGHDNLYDKVILLSSALLFNEQEIGGEAGKIFHEQMKSLIHLLKNAHPFTYRTSFSKNLERYLLGKSRKSRKGAVIDSLRKIQRPTLVVHGENDTSVPISTIKDLEQEVMNTNISWKYIPSSHSTSSYSEVDLTLIQNFIET